MTTGELRLLAKHLGHDIKTHKEYYQLSTATQELSKVRFERAYYDIVLGCHLEAGGIDLPLLLNHCTLLLLTYLYRRLCEA